MVLAYHLIWVAYGWWLPNDPRGSTSRVIASDVIGQLGELHYGRKRVQPASREIRQFYERASEVLKFPLLRFSPREVGLIAEVVGQVTQSEKYTCYACAVMPDHVHVVIRKHRDKAETMIQKIQDATRDAMRGLREDGHPIWGGPGWKVYLDTPDDIRRTIKYVEDNPIHARAPRQQWDFVTTYDGWPFHRRAPRRTGPATT